MPPEVNPMENSKKKSIILIAVLIFLFVLSYFYRAPIVDFFKTWQKIEPRNEIKLQEQTAEIIKTKDFGQCEKIDDELYKTVCRNNISLNLAQETQDISYCQKIDNKLISIEDCERQVIFQKSLDKEDINVCKETQNQELQKQCQDAFWPSLALKNSDVNLCNNALAEQEKNFCRDNYLFQKEFIQNTAQFNCQKFTDEQVKADCKIYKESLGKQAHIVCTDLKSNLFSNYCFLNNLKEKRF